MVSHFPCLIFSKKEAFFVKIFWFNLVKYELNVWKNNNFIWVSDLRCLPLVENMVTIYRSLDAAFSASILQSRSGMVSSYTLI
jgi:hypothetical protein